MTTLKTLTMGLNRFLSRLFSDMPETIDYLNGADSLPPPLNKEEEKKAFELLKTDEKKAREYEVKYSGKEKQINFEVVNSVSVYEIKKIMQQMREILEK